MTAFLYFLMYIPSLSGNFTIHTSIPAMIRELQGPAVFRRRIVLISVFIAISAALVIFLCVGFMGAGMFGASISDNLLKGFGPCKWLWADIVGILYAFVVIITFPLVVYPVKISIVASKKLEPLSKEGYRLQVIVSIVFVAVACVLACVLESIVVVFGLFSSIAGFVMLFAVPIWFIVQNPRVKKENVHMDHLEAGDVVVDPIIVGVLSMVTTT
jgi:amino acid permease